jgi:hypothetical protein
VVAPASTAMWEAMFSLAWFGVLRPGEFTVPTTGGYDVTVHPSVKNVIFFYEEAELQPGDTTFPTHMVFVVKHSKTDQDRLTKDVVIGPSRGSVCALTAMWNYLSSAPHRLDGGAPLFVEHARSPKAVTYTRMRTVLTACLSRAGLKSQAFGGHSFRIGGSQALAAAGKSVLYIMSYGRWRCAESVLRYVTTPEFVRALDAAHMVTALVDAPWTDVQLAIDQHYSRQSNEAKLWTAPAMLTTTSSRQVG